MTKEESIIISAYTGFMLTKNFSDIHEFIEKTLERPVFTHEMANKNLLIEIQKKLSPKIIELIKTIEEN